MTTRFWYSWPSWVVELLSGFAVSTGVWWLLRWPELLVQLLVGTAISVVYELTLDPNGWSVRDVVEREVGLGLGALLWALIIGGR